MKKIIAALLAVLLLASVCVSAFAADADVNVEVEKNVTGEMQELFDKFGKLFAENEELQELAGENGITLGDVLFIDGIFDEPVTIELELDDPQLVSGLVRMVDGKPVTYPAQYNENTGKVEVTLSEAGEYTVAKKVIDYRTVTRTVYEEQMTTVMIDSVEYEEMMLVEREIEELEEFESTMFVVVPGDNAHVMNKEERVAFEEDVQDLTENFTSFTAANAQFVNSAPSNSFFIPAFTPEQQALLPIRQRMKIADADIFSGLLVKTADGQWKVVDAAIDADGYLVFTMAEAGAYVILSQVA